MDDEVEAAYFISNHIKDAIAFTVYIMEGEEEQDCTGVAGSSTFYEFR